MTRDLPIAIVSMALLAASACSGTVDKTASPNDDTGTAASDDSSAIETSSEDSASDSTSSSDVADSSEAAPADTEATPGDGGVTTPSCLKTFALAHDLPHDVEGALEGDLVGIDCPGDTDHLHLQVAVGSKHYDIAIPVFDSMGGAPIGVFTKDLPAGSAPSGWSDATFSYVSALGVHSSAFTMLDKAGMIARLKSELQYGHVSIHGKSYSDGSGVHDVHYLDGTHDGVVLLRGRGASGTDHAIAVRYSSGTF